MDKAKGIVWDLHDLYASAEDERIEHDLTLAQQQAAAFHDTYYGKIRTKSCSAGLLLQALLDYEAVLERIYRPYVMASLLLAADGLRDSHKALIARVQDIWSKIENTTLFFGLEIQKMPAGTAARLMKAPELAHYRHHLEALRALAPYSLSESEEKIINRKNLSGRIAFVNLFDEFTAGFEWEFELNGEKRRLTQSELRQLTRHPDRETRYRAKAAHDGKYGEHALIFTNIFNNLIKDHATEIELRGYSGPMAPSLLANKINESVVSTMMQVVVEHYRLAQTYYRLKAKMLAVEKLRGSDLYAPIISKVRELPFDEGKRLVLESFNDFSPEFGELISQVFSKCWIDAEVRPGKRGGAFCHGVTPSLHPYVLVNYVDNLDSVYTLAHELGHSLHDMLAAEHQTLLTYHPPLVLAETASVFAEMLLTRKLLATVQESDFRMQIIAAKLEDFFGTISRQTMYTLFERDVHEQGGKRRLSADDFCRLWTHRRDELYADVVDFLPEEKWFWAVIPHFIHSRFYCYAYTFGALLVLALFNQYEKSGEAFIPRYRQLLAAGDSDWPEKLVGAMGMDFGQREFWAGGFKVVQSLLDALQALVEGK